MLILSRKQSESVQIGDDIIITIFDIGRGQVRMGFDVPKSVKIVRSELLDPNHHNYRNEGAE